jgi:hypothetical protein
MSRTYRIMVGIMVVGMLCSGVLMAAAGQEDPNLSGTLTLTATSVAAGVGWTWGSGTLTLLNGKEYRMKVSGLDVAAVGVKQATAVGKVYHLKRPKDIEGKYVAGTAGASIGGGAAATQLRNEKGVIINLTSVSEGVDFRLALSGMDIRLRK